LPGSDGRRNRCARTGSRGDGQVPDALRVASPANRVAGEGRRSVIDDIADWDDAYVLGALSRDDRHLYETYLPANPDRAAALTELAGLPGILNMLSCDEALALIEKAGDDTTAVLALDLMPSLAFAAVA